MMSKFGGELILGLETGIDGGSIAILREEKSLCSAEGAGNLSRSEDLLSLIDELLDKYDLLKEDIGTIAVSDSPGSLTGIRIGLAIAAGLGNSLNVNVLRISVLEALAAVSTAGKNVISIVYAEKGGIFYRKFRMNADVWMAETEILNLRQPEDFVKIFNDENTPIILEKKLAHLLEKSSTSGEFTDHNKVQVIECNLAECVALAARRFIGKCVR